VAELERESILGLDNIRLDLPIASVGSRSLAAFLDYVLVVVVQILWVVTVLALGTLPGGSWAVALVIAGWFVLEWGWFAGWEIATGGRTPGKMALKIRVVTAEGGTPGAGMLLARNIPRSIDLLVGVALMAFDPLARRLGDRLAGTLVVHDRRKAGRRALGRVPPGWGAREVAVVEAFLARQGEMADVSRTWEMARRILRRVERDAPSFLEGLDTANDPVGSLRRALQVDEG
jgi:uncharacterized RDD family membrane protein YckC